MLKALPLPVESDLNDKAMSAPLCVRVPEDRVNVNVVEPHFATVNDVRDE